MPTHKIPRLSMSKDVSGERLKAGDIVTPLLVIHDAADKVTFSRGTPVTLVDIYGPNIDGDPVLYQSVDTYTFGVTAGTATDATPGRLEIYVVLAESPINNDVLRNITPQTYPSGIPDYMFKHVELEYVPETEIRLADLGISIDSVRTSQGTTARIGQATPVYAHIIALRLGISHRRIVDSIIIIW
jgi:hypothetical protein